ncbi:MAG: alkaline phosphatase family protein [Parabacteroides gordonii]|uniref:alkaline phosphatase family protein n=1 Tax=Parabacteroides gordonii TaxID=574930 RepID=UPI003A83D95D|nr:alkaline phosphatase [Parabacteroides gordonii]
MKNSRRNFFKKGLAGAVALGTASITQPVTAITAKVNASAAKRIVLISLDGICVDGFLKAKTPNLDALLAEGSLSLNTRVVMPSVTLPNWTSHLTGSGPEQHGVVDNSWEISKFILPAIETDSEGYYPSVFKVLKEALPQVKTAFYYNWINLFYPYNKQYLDEVSYLEEDAYVPNYEKALSFLKENRKHPTLVFLYSVHTDHAGHKYKWMSPEYIKSIEEADVEIGRFIDKMKQEGLYNDTHFMFLTDHGGINYGHGGVSTDEMIVPWGITGPRIKKGFKITEANNTVNTAATILHLFKVKQPLSWTGEVIESIFK